MNKITKQCVAAVASLAMAGTLCVAGAVVAGSSAWAAQTACDASKAPWATDQTANCVGSIKITKYKDELEKNHEGKYVQSKKTQVAGAKFKVTPVKKIDGVDISLTKPEDWLKVAAKIPALNAKPGSLAETDLGTPLTEQTTDSNGVTTFENLGIGLYKVEETQAANGYEKLANPFFMTVPEITRDAKSTDNTYKYKVEVEPKNAYTKDAITKTVDTKGMVGAQDDLPYTITTTVVTTTNTPVADRTKDDYKDFAVWDDALISAYDGMKDLTSANAKKLVTEVKIGSTPITNSENKEDKYTVTVADSDVDKNGGTATRKRITVAFTDTENGGLDAIAKDLAKNPNDKLTVTFKFKLSKTVATGALVNRYGYQKGHNKNDTKPDPDPDPDPDPKSTVTLVKFQIKKVNGTDGTTALPGAKFAIFAKEEDAKACAADSARSDANCKKANTSYAKGFENAATGTPAAVENDPTANAKAGLTNAFKVKAGETFYVVETAAPKNFALSPIVEKVLAYDDTTKPKGTVDPNGNYANGVFTYTFKDVPTKDDGSWFKLPKTGAAGVIIFALIGLGLVGSGMFVFLKNRKKEEEQAA